MNYQRALSHQREEEKESLVKPNSLRRKGWLVWLLRLRSHLGATKELIHPGDSPRATLAVPCTFQTFRTKRELVTSSELGPPALW